MVKEKKMGFIRDFEDRSQMVFTEDGVIYLFEQPSALQKRSVSQAESELCRLAKIGAAVFDEESNRHKIIPLVLLSLRERYIS